MDNKKTISANDVEHMAQLSRLSINNEDINLFADQFGKILTYMDILQNIDTTNIEPLYSPALHTCPLREDKAKNKREKTDMLSNSPKTDGNYHVVPRIV